MIIIVTTIMNTIRLFNNLISVFSYEVYLNLSISQLVTNLEQIEVTCHIMVSIYSYYYY